VADCFTVHVIVIFLLCAVAYPAKELNNVSVIKCLAKRVFKITGRLLPTTKPLKKIFKGETNCQFL